MEPESSSGTQTQEPQEPHGNAVVAVPHLEALRHDLRTPLGHILGYAEMVMDDAGDASTSVSAPLTTIQEIAQRILAMITELLVSERGLTEFIQATREPIREINQCLQVLEQQGGEVLTQQSMQDLRSIALATKQFESIVHGEAGETSAGHVEAASGQPTNSSRGALLVVDDDPANRDLLSRHLKRQGYGVAVADGGARALQRLSAGGFDLVLLDLIMPDVSGLQVLQAMKESGDLCEIPVIMISALDETKSVVRCIEMGAEDYLPKPFDPVLLRARIEASLEKKRLRDKEKRRAEELERTLAELRRMQDQLIVQEKLASLGSLTAGIAHEIKNPLNFVTNFAALSQELLSELKEELGNKLDDSPDSAQILVDLGHNLAKIEEHGKRADRIVRGMLMHARGKSGEWEEADLNQLLSDCMSLAYHGLKANDSSLQIQMEMDLDPNLTHVRVVPQDLSRVLLNIVNNACHAAHERQLTSGGEFSPRVRAQTRKLAGGAEIRIRDNGCGIPVELRSKIFEPFFTTKPAGVGTGLGLSLSYEVVVREHKGELRVESEPGGYAEFIIVLPSGAEEAAV